MASLLTSIFGDREEKPVSLELFNEKAHHHPPIENGETDTTIFTTKRHEEDRKETFNPSAKRQKKEDERVKKEEQERQEKLTIFVGNLPVDMTRKHLGNLFASCGKVVTTRIRSAAITPVRVARARDPDLVKKAAFLTGKLNANVKASVHGYVLFETDDAVQKALLLNNTKLEDGRRIRVDTAVPSWTENTKRAVFVGNLPFDDADAETGLHQHFAKHCSCEEEDIEAVRVIRDKETFASKGFGYVLFTSSALQATALRCVPGTKYKDRELRVMPCRKEKRKSKEQQTVGKTSVTIREEKPQKSKTKPGGSDGRVAEDKAKVVGALRRLLAKDEKASKEKKKRARGAPKTTTPHKSGVSKKKAKADKLVHKMIQKKVDKEISQRKRK
ncbi:nucleolar protein 12 [Fistulifera solaris]|jgi:RNA recognition motif-containing protein|uniref:Nucleolar protein 12 n=1 Tax=Fistulifera solaris TaxID=1519565 RepID=A0A1Z5KB72_FISSO|nr:nucleolar protein 12 [Fistulifera solaris]|eukprot:GAX23178.1 nucleolar protein 12 [Fistulifera solaris]